MELDLMNKKETDRLGELEAVIKEDLRGFVRVGMALKEIYNKKLFRGKYTTWKEYLKNEWDISKSYANYQISASDVVGNLEKMGHHGGPNKKDDSEEPGHNCGPVDSKESSYTFDFGLPKNERQARPLTLLSPEQQPEAWKTAVQMSGHKVTALAVTKVVQGILEAQLEEEKHIIQEDIVKEVTVPDDFSDQFNRLLEILDLHRKSGWKEFNRKKALEFVAAIESYINS